MKNFDTNKINFLHLVQSLGVGGAEILLLHYLKSLGTNNINHYVYCFGDYGPVKEKIENLGIAVYMGPKRGKVNNPITFIKKLLVLIRDLKKFVKKNEIQIIQAHLQHANQLGVFIGKLSGIPSFPTVHNTSSFEDKRSKFNPRFYFIKFVDAIVYRIAYKIIAVSKEIKDIIKAKFKLDDSKIIILKNGIYIDDLNGKSNNCRINYGRKTNLLKIIGVGSLTYQKAFEVLIEATAYLVEKKFENVLVRIAGDGPEKKKLLAYISKFGLEEHVKLLGIRDDIMSLLKNSDIFVIPSRHEGLSIAMIEAMACGLPIIAADVPGLKNYINDGKNGLLFPLENARLLSRCILRLVKDEKLRKYLSIEARKSFEKEYDMRKNIRILNSLLAEFCK